MESGEVRPTLKQAEAFARGVHLPVGYLFLAEPPEETVPIPDYRTVAGQPVARPSPNLLDTIYACQERQAWYRDFVRGQRQPELGFVGSVTVRTPPETAAARMRETLGVDLAVRRTCPTWTDALRLFIRHADDAGVLVMVSGVVMSNTYRRLDPAEFRGFALSDSLAPLVFVNGADTKAAQMFTLAHELAHLWLGASALSNSEAAPGPGFLREEVWCNAVAAEFLVPLAELRPECTAARRCPTPCPGWHASSRSAPWSFCGACSTPAGSTGMASTRPGQRKSHVFATSRNAAGVAAISTARRSPA